MVAVKKTNKQASEKPFQDLSSGESTFPKLLKMPKVFVPIIIIVIFGILFYFKGLLIAAIVNGQPISRIALIQELERKDGKQALSSLVTEILISQEAQKKHIDVSQKELDEEVKKVEDNFKKQGQSLDQYLDIKGLTRKDLINQIRIQKLVEKMLARDIKVTDKEVSDYIEKNKDSVPKDMKPEDVKTSARQQLEQQKLASKAQPWLQNLQKNAKIKYFVNF